jgi:methanethiol S-methyltransferase
VTRFAIFLFGIFAYLVFFCAFLYAIGFVGGFGTPTSLDAAPKSSLVYALTVDFALLAAFALRHRGMARPAFKRWWTKIVPAAAERSVYVLFSSLP